MSDEPSGHGDASQASPGKTAIDTPTVTQPEPQSSPRSKGEVFSNLIRDRRICTGSFKLWHALHDYVNPKTGQCWPGQRRLADDIGCKPHSMRGWLGQLVSAGWLAIECDGQEITACYFNRPGKKSDSKKGRKFIYTLLDGHGQPLPRRATVGVAPNGNTSKRFQKRCPVRQQGVAPLGNGALPEKATEGKTYSNEIGLSLEVNATVGRDSSKKIGGAGQPAANPGAERGSSIKGGF